MSLQRLVSTLGLVLGLFAPLEAVAALTISIEMGPDSVRPGEPLTAQITVANNGVAAVAGVVMVAPTPTGVNSFSPLVLSSGTVAATCTQSVSNNGVCDPLEAINWNLGTIPAGASITVSAAMTVAAATPAGSSITLSPSALSGTVGATASVTVSTANALVLAVDENQDPIPAGGTLTYTLTYGNRSTSSVTGSALTFPLPANTTFVSATGGGTLVGNEVQWSLGTLPATQSDQQQVVVSVSGALGAGSVLQVDNALLTGTSLSPESARAMAVTSIANPVLGLAVEMNPDPVRPGEWTIAELTVTNRTGAAAFGVALQTRVPAGIGAFFAGWATPGLAAASALACVQGISNNGACDALELGNWALGTIPAGASVTVSLALPVAAATAAGRLLTLESRVVDDSFHQSLLDQTAAVDSDNPLTLAVDENVEPIGPSGLLTYTLTYANRSTTSMTSTGLTFPIPAGATFVSATGGGALSGGKVQWALGNLPATQSGQQQVVVSVNAGLGAGSILLVDTALITGTGVLQENARATATTTVAATPVLGLAVEVNPDPARINEWALAQFTVTNRTANALFGVTLSARFPQEMVTENAGLFTGTVACVQTINNGACDAVEIGNWTIGTLPAGASVVVAAPIGVPNDVGLVGRLFTLETRVNDDSTHQALVKQSIAIDSDSPMTLAVDEEVDPVRSGTVQTYTLTYANRSSTAMSGTALTFPLPAGTTLVSATGGGTLVGGNVVWALGNLPATQADSQQVVVAVDGGLAEGSILLVDAAQLTGTGVLPEVARATAASAVTASPALGLAVEVGPDPVRFNEWGYPEVTVTNRTSNALFNVVLQVRFPVGMNAVNAGTFTGGGGSCIQGYLNNGACDNLELGVWSLGSLAPGASTTVSAPFPVTNSATLDGRLITVETFVNDDSSHRSATRQTIAIDGNNPLTLAVDESTDAVPAGNFLTYTLTYGNRSTSAVTGATLSFPLPAQASLAGSTGGVVSNGALVWNLGTLAAGTGGRRQVFMNVPGAVPAGSILLSNEAVLRGTILVPETARANTAVAVEASKALGLSLTFGRDPTQASAALNGNISVTNNTGASLNGIALDVRVPLGVNNFSPALLTGTVTGTCVQSISNNGACDNLERATWAIPTLASGATASELMPMTAVAGLANGRLVYLDARVNDDAGHVSTLSRTALVAPFVDGDADTVHDTYDNCPFFANASQVDTDLDGRGDPCECTDQNGDGRNTVTDILAINTAIFNPGLVTPLCDGNNDGQCNVNDIIACNIEIFSPTNTSTCSRSPVAGP